MYPLPSAASAFFPMNTRSMKHAVLSLGARPSGNVNMSGMSRSDVVATVLKSSSEPEYPYDGAETFISEHSVSFPPEIAVLMEYLIGSLVASGMSLACKLAELVLMSTLRLLGVSVNERGSAISRLPIERSMSA